MDHGFECNRMSVSYELNHVVTTFRSMALTPGSERTESWLRPPVQPHLTAYAFHVTNPEAVLAGKKPVLEEKGPFVYKVNFLWVFSGTSLCYGLVCCWLCISRV